MKKNWLLILFIAVAALISCNKDKPNQETQTASVSGLPTKAEAYIDNNYPDAAIEYVVTLTNNAAAYLVTLNTSEELAFDTQGGYLGKGGNYHGGNQIECDTIYGGHHGGGHHEGGIPIDSLSVAILEYISVNYPGYGIMHAEIDTLCPDGAVTNVMIGMPGSEPIKLVFNSSDIYLLKANRISYADAPQAVRDFISANYTDYAVCDKAEKFTLPDNLLQYMIYLRLDQIKTKLRMAEDGTLICDHEIIDSVPGPGGHHGGGHHGGGHPGGGHHEGGIPLDLLSQVIKDYVAANYAGYNIQHAEFGVICPDGNVTEVMIGMPGSDPLKLIFGAGDAFLLTANLLPYSDVPQIVKDYIAANYPDYNVGEKAEKLTLLDNSIQYRIFIMMMHHMKKTVLIAEDGTFICVQ
jgi:hypothetical protein